MTKVNERRNRATELLFDAMKKNLIQERTFLGFVNKITLGKAKTIENLIEILKEKKKKNEKIYVKDIKQKALQKKQQEKKVDLIKNRQMVVVTFDAYRLIDAYQLIERKDKGKNTVFKYYPEYDEDKEEYFLKLTEMKKTTKYSMKVNFFKKDLKKFLIGKELFIPFIKDYKKQYPKRNGSKFIDKIVAINESNYTNHLVIDMYGGVIVITDVDDIGKVKKIQKVKLNLGEENAKKINFRYISYDSEFKSKDLKKLIGDVNMNEYLEKNYKKDSCIYTTIINAYKNAFMKAQQNGRYVNFDLTYESLWNIIHPDKEYDSKKALKDTVLNATRFFEHFKLKFYCIDINYKVIHKYIPESINKHLNPRSFFVLVHNNHCYEINSELDRLEKIVSDIDENDFDIKEPSNNFYFSQFNKSFTFINDIVDLKKINFEKEEKVIVYYTGDLNMLLKKLLYDIDYVPKITCNNFVLTSITIKIGQCQVHISDPSSCQDDINQDFKSAEYYIKFCEYEKKLYENVLSRNNLSTYSESLIDALNTYSRGPIMCSFINPTKIPKDILAHDYNKAYTSNLLDLGYIPVFNSFDVFREYKNETIKDYSIYFVEKIGSAKDEFILLDKKFNLISGYTLNRVNINVKILSVCHPSILQLNSSSNVIKQIYDSDLEIIHKKFIVNKIIGLTGKKYNKISASRLYFDKDEAYTDSKDLEGGRMASLKIPVTYKIKKDENGNNEYFPIYDKEKIYIVSNTKKTNLDQGFLPIQFFIYDIMRLKMYNLYQKLSDQGAKIYGMNTDSLYINGDFEYKKKKRDNNVFESIGKTRFDVVETYPNYDTKSVIENKNELDVVPSTVIKEIKIKDEFNQELFNEVFNKNTIVILKASIPGAGKTTCLKKYAEYIGKDRVLFVAPYNTLCFEFKEEGFDSCTLYQLLCIRLQGNTDVQSRSRFSIEDYDCIVFDEIYCYATKNLQRIKNFMEENFEKRFFATGDLNQNRPIERLNLENYKEYYDEIINSMFPNQIDLKICKRMKKKEDQELLKEIRQEILYSKHFDAAKICRKYFKVITDVEDIKGTMITYRNETADILNRYFHSTKEVPEKSFVHNGVAYYPGMKLRCRYYLKFGVSKVYVNFTYNVIKINEKKKNIHIEDPFNKEVFKIDKNQLKFFTLNYAQTCHSLQGITVDDNITIFDSTFYFANREWLWTAVTRCKSLQNIRVFIDNNMKQNKKIIKQNVLTKISAHKREDKKKGRDFDEEDYIDLKEFKSMYEAQQGCCNRCNIALSIEYQPKSDFQFSINRIDNNLAHTKGNCEIVCLTCQRAYKKMGDKII